MCVGGYVNPVFVGVWRYVHITQYVRSDNLQTKLGLRPWSRKLLSRSDVTEIVYIDFVILASLRKCWLCKRKLSFLCGLLTFQSRLPLFFYISSFTAFSLWLTPQSIVHHLQSQVFLLNCSVTSPRKLVAFSAPDWRQQAPGLLTNTMSLVLTLFSLLTVPHWITDSLSSFTRRAARSAQTHPLWWKFPEPQAECWCCPCCLSIESTSFRPLALLRHLVCLSPPSLQTVSCLGGRTMSSLSS